LAAAFERIDHDHVLSQLGRFPARDQIRRWLRAGVVDRGRFAPTGEGVPQNASLGQPHEDPPIVTASWAVTIECVPTWFLQAGRG
jgi:hypothetical protein